MGNKKRKRTISNANGHESAKRTDQSNISSSNEYLDARRLAPTTSDVLGPRTGRHDDHVLRNKSGKAIHNLGRCPPSPRSAYSACHALQYSSDIVTAPTEQYQPTAIQRSPATRTRERTPENMVLVCPEEIFHALRHVSHAPPVLHTFAVPCWRSQAAHTYDITFIGCVSNAHSPHHTPELTSQPNAVVQSLHTMDRSRRTRQLPASTTGSRYVEKMHEKCTHACTGHRYLVSTTAATAILSPARLQPAPTTQRLAKSGTKHLVHESIPSLVGDPKPRLVARASRCLDYNSFLLLVGRAWNNER